LPVKNEIFYEGVRANRPCRPYVSFPLMTDVIPALAQIKYITGFDFVLISIITDQFLMPLYNVAMFVACPFQAVFSWRAFPNPSILAFIIPKDFQSSCSREVPSNAAG
jgi:hypothetical protein